MAESCEHKKNLEYKYTIIRNMARGSVLKDIYRFGKSR